MSLQVMVCQLLPIILMFVQTCLWSGWLTSGTDERLLRLYLCVFVSQHSLGGGMRVPIPLSPGSHCNYVAYQLHFLLQ